MATTAHHLSVFRGVRESCMEEGRLAHTLEPEVLPEVTEVQY